MNMYMIDLLKIFALATVLHLVGTLEPVFGQDVIRWFNPQDTAVFMVAGRGWSADSTEGYSRMPKGAKGGLPGSVWHLSEQSAGLSLQFRTPARKIWVRYTVSGPLDMPHMPATGVSGIDLYAVSTDGDWQRVSGSYGFADTIVYAFTALPSKVGAYRLYLPLYNKVEWLEIGLADSVDLEPLRPVAQLPIVVFGTSIVQGACATRPGLAWTAMLERELDRSVINLGFSGNALLQPEVIQQVASIEAAAYILDCMPNAFTLPADTLGERIKQAVLAIRRSKKNVPIILTEDVSHNQLFFNDFDGGARERANDVVSRSIEELATLGISGVYRLSANDIDFDDNATVDGVHPGDIGMKAYADTYEKLLREVLNEPKGKETTTRARRQYREFPFYDWDERHRSILAANESHPPRHVLLGNSIVHYWGGIPSRWPSRGRTSWERDLQPAGFANMGFGWDRIENVLWRVYNGALQGFEAESVIIMIGTNNLADTSDEDVCAGLVQLVQAVRERQPKARILLCGILPRASYEDRILAINRSMASIATSAGVDYADLGGGLTDASGRIIPSLFVDGLHPNENGYELIATRLTAFFF